MLFWREFKNVAEYAFSMLFLEAEISVGAIFYTFSMSAYHGHHHHYLQCQQIYHHLSPYSTFTRLGLVVFSLFPRIKCTIKLYFGHKLCICIWGSRRGRDALASLLCYCQWPASPFGNARIFGHFSVKFGQSLVTFLWIFVFLLSTHSLLLCLAKAPIEQRKDLIWNRFKDPPFNWFPGQLVPSRDLTVENDLPLHLSCISGDFVPHTLVSRQDRCAPQSKSH